MLPSLFVLVLLQAPVLQEPPVVPGLVDGAITLRAGGRPTVVYRARRVEPPAGLLDRVFEDNRKYARPRSGYLHPLFGPGGEELTKDWSEDHPHHRGIYWAWPEVRWGDRLGDLHALQKVFSRPVGEPRVRCEGDGAAVEAKNVWLWRDEHPVVYERVHVAVGPGEGDDVRLVDLAISLRALAKGITLARRRTALYGGLNVRLAAVEALKLDHHSEPATGAHRARAWSLATGTWQGGSPATFAILEHPDNPHFPGDFVTYPDLPWFQPAFPRAKRRHALEPGQPLVLRYRYLVIPGRADPASLHAAWDRHVRHNAPSPEKGTDR